MQLQVAPRGWHRPVSLKSLFWVGAGVLGAWLGLILGAAWFVYTQLDARMALREQTVGLRLPPGLRASAVVSHPLRSEISLRPSIDVHVKQRLSARVDDTLLARATLEATLPVRTVVKVDQVVPVRTVLRMQVPVVSWLPAFDVDLPITLNLPVQAEVPLQADVPVKFEALVSGQLTGPVDVPVDQVFRLRPQVRGAIEAEVKGEMDFVVHDAIPPLLMTIEQADLLVPFDVPRIRQRQRD
jgi:hypothetical protein